MSIEDIAFAKGYCAGLDDLKSALLEWFPEFDKADQVVLEGVVKAINEAHEAMDLFYQVLVQKTLMEGADIVSREA